MNATTKNLLISLHRETMKAPTTSAWKKGVKAYAVDLLSNLIDLANDGTINAEIITSPALLKIALLNGASNWTEYSEGGCALIYDHEIARRLCTASEYRRTDHGYSAPNARETWLDVQARALQQAANIILTAAAKLPAVTVAA